MAAVPHCPTHPRYPVDSCPVCEAKIARAELERDDPQDEGMADHAADRYEQWMRGSE